jgi:hypothetical protein
MAFIMVGKLVFDSKDLCKSLRHTVQCTYVCYDTAYQGLAMMSGAARKKQTSNPNSAFRLIVVLGYNGITDGSTN